MPSAQSLLAIGAALALLACSGSDASSSSSGTSGSSCPNDLPSSCPSAPPSYAKDIAPVVQRTCGSCHAPGLPQGTRPLVTYDELHAQRSGALNQIHACKMPPAGTTLSADERHLLQTWLVCGAPDN